MPAQNPIDPNLYPRTYGISGGWKFFLLLFGLGLLGGGLFMVWKYCDDTSAKDAIAFAILGPLFALGGFYVIADTMLSKVVIYADAIELHDLWPMRRLERADIKGRKLQQGGEAGSTLVFVPNDAAKKKMKLPMIVRKDAEMEQWINTLPDLDAQDQAESLKEVMQDLGDSGTPEERLASLAAAKKQAKSLKVTTGIACAVGYFLPGYIPIAVLLAILPWWALALAARSPGLYTLNDHKNDARAGVGIAFIMPGFILMLGMLMNYHLLDWTPVHAAAIAVALFMAFLASLVDKQLIRKKSIFLVGPLMAAYGYGVLVTGNALADRSDPEKFETHVISKHYTSGKGAHPEVKIDSWGGHPGDEVPVNSLVYNTVNSGSLVCVYLHKGALGVPWYYVDLCHL